MDVFWKIIMDRRTQNVIPLAVVQPMMEVIISVGGIFHAFELAEQLKDRDSFHSIYTTYPKFKLTKYNIPSSKITSVRHAEAVYQIIKFPALRRVIPRSEKQRIDSWKSKLFDRAVARKLPEVDNGIFVGFAGMSIHSLSKANKLGFTTVVERASVHIEKQNKILNKEAAKFGLPQPQISDEQIESETREYQLADYIMTPSNFVAQSFLEYGFDEEKIKTVPIGRTSSEIEAIDNSEDTDSQITYYLFAGQVSYQKGVPYLLDAWEKLKLDDAELIFLGDVDEDIKSYIRPYRKREDIHFMGWVDDIYSWYRKGDVLVFPSVQDGFGMVVTEAMGAGLPVIVTENVGAKDCVREGKDGFIIPVCDSNAIADAIQFLHDNSSKREAMGESAREHTLKNYTLEDYGDEVVSVYQTMLEQKS